MTLTASNPARNVSRFYTIRLYHNLLQQIVVSLSYGRLGTHGNVKHTYWDDHATAHRYIRKILHKRLNAKNRIGCDYTLQPVTKNIHTKHFYEIFIKKLSIRN